jgi:hypothetical protein
MTSLTWRGWRSSRWRLSVRLNRRKTPEGAPSRSLGPERQCACGAALLDGGIGAPGQRATMLTTPAITPPATASHLLVMARSSRRKAGGASGCRTARSRARTRSRVPPGWRKPSRRPSRTSTGPWLKGPVWSLGRNGDRNGRHHGERSADRGGLREGSDMADFWRGAGTGPRPPVRRRR